MHDDLGDSIDLMCFKWGRPGAHLGSNDVARSQKRPLYMCREMFGPVWRFMYETEINPSARRTVATLRSTEGISEQSVKQPGFIKRLCHVASGCLYLDLLLSFKSHHRRTPVSLLHEFLSVVIGLLVLCLVLFPGTTADLVLDFCQNQSPRSMQPTSRCELSQGELEAIQVLAVGLLYECVVHVSSARALATSGLMHQPPLPVNESPPAYSSSSASAHADEPFYAHMLAAGCTCPCKLCCA